MSQFNKLNQKPQNPFQKNIKSIQINKRPSIFDKTVVSGEESKAQTEREAQIQQEAMEALRLKREKLEKLTTNQEEWVRDYRANVEQSELVEQEELPDAMSPEVETDEVLINGDIAEDLSDITDISEDMNKSESDKDEQLTEQPEDIMSIDTNDDDHGILISEEDETYPLVEKEDPSDLKSNENMVDIPAVYLEGKASLTEDTWEGPSPEGDTTKEPITPEDIKNNILGDFEYKKVSSDITLEQMEEVNKPTILDSLDISELGLVDDSKDNDFLELNEQENVLEEEKSLDDLISEADDLNSPILIPTGNAEDTFNEYIDVINTMNSEVNQLSNTMSDAEVSDIVYSKYGKVKEIVDTTAAFFNEAQNYQSNATSRMLDNKGKLEKSWIDPDSGTNHQDKLADNNIVNSFKGNEVILTGDTALTFVAAVTSGAKRTFLPNSGFYIDLRGPKNTELDVFRKAVKTEHFEYGKIFGQYFFSPMGYLIQRVMLDMLPSFIVKSNLIGWNIGETLIRNISVQDYDTIIHSLASLIHQNGATINFKCHKSDCPKPITSIKSDLNQMKFTNYTAMPLECKKMLYSVSDKNSEQLTNYRTKLGFNVERQLTENWIGKMQVPTLYEHFDYHTRFNAELETLIQTAEEETITRHLNYAKNKFFTPWIEELSYVDKVKNKKIIIKDRDKLPEVLAYIQTVPEKTKDFFDNCVNYTMDTKLTYIGYPYTHCPACNSAPHSTVGGIIPCDVQSTFFTLSVMKLNSLQVL